VEKPLLTLLFFLAALSILSAQANETVEFMADGVVNDASVRLRDTPGLNGAILGLLQKGDNVHILARSTRPEQIDNMISFWYYVARGNKKGYCYGYYIDLEYASVRPDDSVNGLIKDIAVSSYREIGPMRDGHPQMLFASQGQFAWVPHGDGVGASIEVVMTTPITAEWIYLSSSYHDDRFLMYHRAKRIKLTLDDRDLFFSCADEQDVSFHLPQEMKFTKWKITILEIHRGRKHNALPFSNIQIHHSPLWCVPIEDLLSDVEGLYFCHGTGYPASFSRYFFPDGVFVSYGGTVHARSREVGTWTHDQKTGLITIICDWQEEWAYDFGDDLWHVREDYYHKYTVSIADVFPPYFGENCACERYKLRPINTDDNKMKIKAVSD